MVPQELTLKFQQAISLHQIGKLIEAVRIYEDILNLLPTHIDALHMLGMARFALGEIDVALDLLNRVIVLCPNEAAMHTNRGNILQAHERYEEALADYACALTLREDSPNTWFNQGAALKALGRYDQALLSYQRALTLNPRDAEAWLQQGQSMAALGDVKQALASYQQALTLEAYYPDAWFSMGAALQQQENHTKAHLAYQRALQLKPDHFDALVNCGSALQALRRSQEALAYYERALLIKPHHIELMTNCARALCELKNFDAAVMYCEKILAIQDNAVCALLQLGIIMQEKKYFAKAASYFERALASNAQEDFLLGACVFTKMRVCDWGHIDDYLITLKQKIMDSEKAALPGHLLAVSSDGLIHQHAAQIYVQNKCKSVFVEQPLFSGRALPHKIRIAYFSADFHGHATAHLIAELFELYDRDNFEVVLFSYGVNLQDAMRMRIIAAVDNFIDVSQQSDEEIVRMARALTIDIAVDLKGFTQESRINIFASRVAPIQINYLAYPGTMGASYMDYIIADHIVIPEKYQAYYTEKIIYLPNSYQVNDRKRPVADTQFSRMQCGLPEHGFIFCCFNNNYKITPQVFACWMRLLKAVEGSVLWLLEDSIAAANNLKKSAQLAGVDPARLVFATRALTPEHLARQKLADLFLDTIPCNAHTTASDALWVGLPVLTCVGESFASRVAASLLNAVGAPELIVDNLVAYEQLALDLANNPIKLAQLKQKIINNRDTSPLFDTPLFVKHLEMAYTQIFNCHQQGTENNHVDVSRLCNQESSLLTT